MNTPVYKIRIKKGDNVIIRSGKYKGKTGTVVATHPKDNKLTVEGINIVKRHTKPNRTHPQGGIIEMTKPIWVSKVSLIDPTSKKPTRIHMKANAKGDMVRLSTKSGKEIK